MTYVLDENLKEFATEIQWKRLQALARHGSERKAAESLGIHRSLIGRAKKQVNKRAARSGYAPSHDLKNPVPDGFKMKGYSILRDAQTGAAKLIWEKAEQTKEDQLGIIKQAVESLCQDIEPCIPSKSPTDTYSHLCNVYTISDFHMGMLAWHREGGNDWDIKIAKEVLMGCFKEMINSSPNAETAIINQLGDFLHSDGILPITPTSGHILDQDGRFSKIVSATVQCLRAVVDLALTKHMRVHVVMAEGNHDITSSIWLRHMFKCLYENEPRVTIDDSDLPYYAYQHGQTSLFFHHGHLKKMQQLPGFFAAQFPKVWGDTLHRYAHTGHLHHKSRIDEKEDSGITLIQHPTLSGRDAYSARHGFHSGRRAISYTYHDKYGEVCSSIVTPEMLQ